MFAFLVIAAFSCGVKGTIGVIGATGSVTVITASGSGAEGI